MSWAFFYKKLYVFLENDGILAHKAAKLVQGSIGVSHSKLIPIWVISMLVMKYAKRLVKKFLVKFCLLQIVLYVLFLLPTISLKSSFLWSG